METGHGTLTIERLDEYFSGEINMEIHQIIYRSADGGERRVGWALASDVSALAKFISNAQARGVIFDPMKE